MRTTKKFISILLAFVMLLLTFTGVGFTSFADSDVPTMLELNSFIIGGSDTELGTTVLESEDGYIQVSVVLRLQDGTLLQTDLENMSVSILELPSLNPYLFTHFGKTMRYGFTANYVNPKTPGDYTLRFAFSGTQEYRSCYIDIPFSVVEQKPVPQIELFNKKISTQEGDSISGRLTDGDGNPIAGTGINITQYAGDLAYISSITTDADGCFYQPLVQEIKDSLNNGYANLSVSITAKANNTHSSATIFKELPVASRVLVVWLDGDGSELDRAYYYAGDDEPVTDKTPVKAEDEDNTFVFDCWSGSINGDTKTYTPVFTPVHKHKAAAPVRENEIPATCESDGSYDIAVYCSVCSQLLSRETKNIPALNHNWGEFKKHNRMQHKKVCANDPSHIIYSSHHWEELMLTKPATCHTYGVMMFSCTDCGDTKAELVPFDSSNHTATETVGVKAADCANEGYTGDLVCKDCGATVENGSVIEKLAHNPGEPVRENEIVPGCLSAGSYDEVVYCADCGTELSRTTLPIVAGGHELVIVEKTEPTETDAGVKMHYVCAQCGEMFWDAEGNEIIEKESDIIIPATGYAPETSENKAIAAEKTQNEKSEKQSISPKTGDEALVSISIIAAICTTAAVVFAKRKKQTEKN